MLAWIISGRLNGRDIIKIIKNKKWYYSFSRKIHSFKLKYWYLAFDFTQPTTLQKLLRMLRFNNGLNELWFSIIYVYLISIYLKINFYRLIKSN
jgi:hypothetical protein